mmetsp:Transcript_35854/g.85002  ORF Transcript_35854/g.85002 Transcript_35854/m.85002 type:complete len:281 (-) Transcript_35854:96-938(-)
MPRCRRLEQACVAEFGFVINGSAVLEEDVDHMAVVASRRHDEGRAAVLVLRVDLGAVLKEELHNGRVPVQGGVDERRVPPPCPEVDGGASLEELLHDRCVSFAGGDDERSTPCHVGVVDVCAELYQLGDGAVVPSRRRFQQRGVAKDGGRVKVTTLLHKHRDDVALPRRRRLEERRVPSRSDRILHVASPNSLREGPLDDLPQHCLVHLRAGSQHLVILVVQELNYLVGAQVRRCTLESFGVKVTHTETRTAPSSVTDCAVNLLREWGASRLEAALPFRI